MAGLVRVSCAMLCRFKVDERYLLLLNRNRRENGLYELSPVGGAIEFYEPSIVSRFALRLETQGSADLRFLMETENLGQFSAWFYQRTGRETDPFREIYEELVTESLVLSALRREDLTITYLQTAEDAKPTERKGVTGLFTRYFLEIFEVMVISQAVKDQLLAADESSGVMIVDEITARQGGTLSLNIDGAQREARLVTDRLFL